MLSTLATALLVSAPLPPSPRMPLAARPAMSWAAGDGDRHYQLDLYRNQDCVLRFGRQSSFTASAIACRWEASGEGISIVARGPNHLRDWPFMNGVPTVSFRVLEGGSVIEWIDDPRFRLERIR